MGLYVETVLFCVFAVIVFIVYTSTKNMTTLLLSMLYELIFNEEIYLFLIRFVSVAYFFILKQLDFPAYTHRRNGHRFCVKLITLAYSHHI